MQMNESVEFVDATCSSPLATPTIQYNTKRRTCLLRDIGIRRKADLTPRKEKLFAVARTMIKKVNLITPVRTSRALFTILHIRRLMVHGLVIALKLSVPSSPLVLYCIY